jgi:environmental stress-induced protein Ves
MLRLIPRSAYKEMRWKNGRGVTLEIARKPSTQRVSSVSSEFAWRVSSAIVPESAEFSIFSGCNRSIAVLEGEGMDLKVGRQEAQRLLTSSQPFFFSGDEKTSATLLSNHPITDFNVITDRFQANQNFAVRIKVGAEAPLEDRSKVVEVVPSEVLVIYCNYGSASISTHSCVKILNAGETCVVHGDTNKSEGMINSIFILASKTSADIIITKIKEFG